MVTPYQAIADDSGCKGQGPVVVMAGMIGEEAVWADFAEQWQAALHEAPRISRFKMYEATKRNGPFAGFSISSRDRKLKALARVMDRDDLSVLHTTIDIEARQAAFSKFFRPENWPKKKRFKAQGVQKSPYFDAYNNFISAACMHLYRRGVREQFDFLVDEHPSLGPRMLDWYPVTRVAMQEPFRSIMPRMPIQKNDESFLPLQAADMIAWLQRDVNTPPVGLSEFAWLNAEFTRLRRSEFCLDAGPDWYADRLENIRRLQEEGPPPIEAMIQLAILEGAPIGPNAQKSGGTE